MSEIFKPSHITEEVKEDPNIVQEEEWITSCVMVDESNFEQIHPGKCVEIEEEIGS